MKDITIEFLVSKEIDTALIQKKKGWFVNQDSPIFSSCQLVIEEYQNILEDLKNIYVSGESDIYTYIEYYERQIFLLNKWIYNDHK